MSPTIRFKDKKVLYKKAKFIGQDVWLTCVAVIFFFALPVGYFFNVTIPIWCLGATLTYGTRVSTKRIFMQIIYQQVRREHIHDMEERRNTDG